METERLAADDAGIARAAELILAGELVAFPTETVYGLGGLASSDVAVEKIFRAKGRPADRPVIVHLAEAALLGKWGSDVPPEAHTLADRFWPGPLTLIIPRSSMVSDTITGGRSSVGVRIPQHEVALRLLAAVGDGVAAPSANRYGHVSPTNAEHVLADLDGRIAAVVDGGACAVGVESTIIEVMPDPDGGPTRVSLLRHGGTALEDIEAALDRIVPDETRGTGEESRAPGMALSHYAPNARLRVVASVDADDAPAGVVVIAPGPGETDGTFASELYARLRAADQDGPEEIWVVPPAEGAILPAILDRLERAAYRS